jgi:N-ethylmaleimide reductase
MSALFAPVALGPLQLQNAVIMAPLTRQRADAMGVPQPHVAEYYSQRADAGLIIAEGTQPSFAGQGYSRTPGMHTPEQVASWKRVTAAIHARGAKASLQMMHAGRIAHRLNRQVDAPPVAPSAIRAAGQIWTDQKQMQDHDTPHALSTQEVVGVVEEFVKSAVLAIEAGFDAVEVHAANGYLHNQFLASNTNQRTDAYGGSVQNRIRFTVEVVEAIGAAIGIERVGIRVSPGHMFNDLRDEKPIETHIALLSALPTAKMAYMHVMLANAFDASLNNAGNPDAILPALRPHVKGAMIAAGGFTAESGEAAMASGLLQAVVFGRPFIANPDLITRMKKGIALSAPDASKFYTPGPEGYSDYPAAA